MIYIYLITVPSIAIAIIAYTVMNGTHMDTGLQTSFDNTMLALSSLGISERIIFTIAVFVIHLFSFYFHAWFFVLADWYGFLDPWSIRSGAKRLPSGKQQWAAIKEGTIDAFIVKPIIVYMVYPLAANYISFRDLPSLTAGCLQWLAMELIFSTSLFFIHGAMHKFPTIYKLVHKRHHTFHETVSFAAQYSHPLEGLASSSHIILSILLVQPHFVVLCVYLWTTFLEIVDSHCGYDVPWAIAYPWSGRYPWGSGARAHDYHHSHNKGTTTTTTTTITATTTTTTLVPAVHSTVCTSE
jgi:sterol desaturase/sphingolipid hydroxylase (fatty acid hydroxylase superfamily)